MDYPQINYGLSADKLWIISTQTGDNLHGPPGGKLWIVYGTMQETVACKTNVGVDC